MSKDNEKPKRSGRPAPGEPRLSDKLRSVPPEERGAFLKALPYEVGFAKPPRKTQFKEGQSGNPKGRPRGAQNLRTLIEKELNTPVVVNVKGKTRKLLQSKVVAKVFINKAQQGDLRAIGQLFKITERSPVHSLTIPVIDNELLRAVLDHLQFQSRLASTGAKTEGGASSGGGS